MEEIMISDQRESMVEYFKEHVEEAIVHQRVVAGELTSYYVVQMLAGFATRRIADEPLACLLKRGLETGGTEQRTCFRQIGDESLFLLGFFSDSLIHKHVDADYYLGLGTLAYTQLSRLKRDAFAPVFQELAEKFVGFVDVLSEVSERSSISTDKDVLRLYERWLKTGSSRSARLLTERGQMHPS
jgi:hypothetical protein